MENSRDEFEGLNITRRELCGGEWRNVLIKRHPQTLALEVLRRHTSQRPGYFIVQLVKLLFYCF